AAAMAELLGRFGLVVFDPSHPAAKRAMAPTFTAVLREGPALDAALARRAGDLKARGLRAPVPVGGGLETVMLEGALGRDRLTSSDGSHVTRRSSERWSQTELERLLDSEPERFSPNVLLRPVIEAALLPTLAYVGGPGELDYLAQSDPLFELIGVSPQARVPRWSVRVVEARVAKTLSKYGLSSEQLEEEGRVEAALVRDDMPPEAETTLQRLRHALQTEYERLESAAVLVDPTLRKTVQSAQHSARGAVDALEKKLLNHLKRRNETVVQQVARARTALFPLGRPQERVLNVTHFLVRYGTHFLEAALDEADRWYATVVSGSGST
ncbi:MAG: bacillithiol biosynthesis BshC, partial [Gemmatimonadales bacterium]